MNYENTKTKHGKKKKWDMPWVFKYDYPKNDLSITSGVLNLAPKTF